MDDSLFATLQPIFVRSYSQSVDEHNTVLSENQHTILQCGEPPITQNTAITPTTQIKKRKIPSSTAKHLEMTKTPSECQDVVIKNSPAYFLNLFLDGSVMSWLIAETAPCISGGQLKNFQPVTEDEMRCFIAILYLSGYIDVPRRRMLWERAPDSHCPLVSNAMQRDRFESIFTALHMGDGLKDDNSRISRLHPLISQLNHRFLHHAPRDDQHSIAECVVPLSNRTRHNSVKYSTKNLKVWCGCTKTGYCVWFNPCHEPQEHFNHVYMGRSTILNYVTIMQRHRASQYSIVFENAYSDIGLLCELQRLGVSGSGADRDKSGCLLNPALGGVDRMDTNVTLYRSSMRGRKSYSAILTYALDVTLQNAWQLYKSSLDMTGEKKQLDLLGFRRNLVIYYLQHYAKPILGHRGGRPSRNGRQAARGKRAAPSDARFDGIRHYVIPQVRQTRCAKCTAKTTTRCQKCDVGVHVKCFVEYHQKPRENISEN